jgi:hypothetical protein
MADISVTIKPNKTTVSSVQIGPQLSLSLGQVSNIDATDPQNGETLVYDAATGKYVVKSLNKVSGGTF